MRPLWLDDLESLEAVSQNEEARKIFLRGDKGRVVEPAQDESFLLEVEEYLVRTHRLH